MKLAVFWVVAPCSLVEVHQRFRGPCCLHHQGDRGATTQKTAIFISIYNSRAAQVRFGDLQFLLQMSSFLAVIRTNLDSAASDYMK
jgi:hypothetical protein